MFYEVGLICLCSHYVALYFMLLDFSIYSYTQSRVRSGLRVLQILGKKIYSYTQDLQTEILQDLQLAT
jgi:hypothetical protein